MQFNDVYGVYCQICVVYYVIDVVVQCDVVQFLLCCLCFMWVFLRLVMYFMQIWLVEQCVVVSVQFVVEVNQIVLFSNYQWINFDQCQVVFKENGCQVYKDFGELLYQFIFQI